MPFYIGPNSQRTEELSHNKIPNKITTSEVKNKAFSVKKKKKVILLHKFNRAPHCNIVPVFNCGLF